MAGLPTPDRGVPAARRLRLPALHASLVPLVAVAAALGLAAPGVAHALRPGVGAMLAAQVLGVALTIPAAELRPRLRRPAGILTALAVQWSLFPLVGLGLDHLAGGVVGRGAFVTACAPAEITSALVTVVAGGSGATAATLMTASVATGCLLMPLWLLLLAGSHVGPGVLVGELALSVALPLVAGVAARSISPRVGDFSRRSLDLAALGLLLVVFVGAGEARSLLTSRSLGVAALLSGVLVVAGGVVGTVSARVLAVRRAERVALAYPIAMREFGVATAVALVVAPRAAAFGGVYGILVMLAAAASAGALGRRGRRAGDGAGDRQRTLVRTLRLTRGGREPPLR